MNTTAEGMNRDLQRQRSVPKVSALMGRSAALVGLVERILATKRAAPAADTSALEREIDPASLQPKVPKLNRETATHLRQHPPPDIEQARFTRALEAAEAPCSLREQKLLRAVFEQDFPSHGAKSRALVEEIERIGLEPFHAPEPFPPITPDDVHLICWMGMEAG